MVKDERGAREEHLLLLWRVFEPVSRVKNGEIVDVLYISLAEI